MRIGQYQVGARNIRYYSRRGKLKSGIRLVISRAATKHILDIRFILACIPVLKVHTTHKGPDGTRRYGGTGL